MKTVECKKCGNQMYVTDEEALLRAIFNEDNTCDRCRRKMEEEALNATESSERDI